MMKMFKDGRTFNKRTKITRRLFAHGLSCFISFFLWNVSLVCAQKDTTNYALPTEIISDSLLAHFQTKIDKITYKRDSLGAFGVSGLSADAVLRQTEGLYVRNYGGHGGIKSVSIRGFAAQQTTVSIMNIPYQSPQNSVINLGNFYLEGFDKIEVTANPAASTQNSLGGNVNFSITPQKKSLQLNTGLGSFGEKIVGARWNTGYKKLYTKFAYQNIRAKDDYPYHINGEEGNRANAGFSSQQYQASMSYRFKQIEATYFLTAYKNLQGVPEAVLTGSPSFSKDSLQQNDVFQFLRLEYQPKTFSSLWLPSKVHLAISEHSNYMKSKALGQQDYYDNHDFWVQLQALHLFPKQSFQTTIQYNLSNLAGDNLAINFRPISAVKREQISLSLQHNAILGKHAEEKYRWHSQSSLRVNVVAPYGLLWNGNWALTKHIKLVALSNPLFFLHLNTGNRLPSFNELYYFAYGNAHLLPEKIRAWDVGFQVEKKLLVPISFKMLFFQNTTQNKIIAVPINPVRWSTQAIGLAKTLGMTYSIEIAAGKYQHFYSNYTFQKTVDASRVEKPLLPYTPIEIFNYGYKYKLKNYFFYLNGNYSGWRFASVQNTQNSFLPAYHVLDVGTGYKWKISRFTYRISTEVMNVLNTNYALIASYPMPRRSFRIFINMEF